MRIFFYVYVLKIIMMFILVNYVSVGVVIFRFFSDFWSWLWFKKELSEIILIRGFLLGGWFFYFLEFVVKFKICLI